MNSDLNPLVAVWWLILGTAAIVMPLVVLMIGSYIRKLDKKAQLIVDALNTLIRQNNAAAKKNDRMDGPGW